MLKFPNRIARRRFGKSDMNVVLNFPNRRHAIRFGKLIRFGGVA